MPIPLILWGAAAAAAAIGVKKGIDAKSDFDLAKSIGESSQEKYKKAIERLDSERNKTQKKLEELGSLKVTVFTSQIKHLIEVIRKNKSASSKLTDFNVELTPEKIKEIESAVLKSLEIEKSLSTGAAGGALAAMGAYSMVGTMATASTGAAISGLSGAAATNATLAWLGGGALSAGGFGMAGGAIALGGIVLGPALAIGGFLMASKAEEAYTEAKKYEAQVDVAIADMKKAHLMLSAVQENIKQLSAVITELAIRFDKVKVYDFSNKPLADQMIDIGINLKKALDIPAISKNGEAETGVQAKAHGLLEV